jgi:iron complex outermembrane recepter protein
MKRALLRGASAATLFIVCGFTANQAMAQASAPASPAPAAAPAGSGEVIVTAQRRNQAIEHVPVAVSAFTAKQRQVLGIATTQQLSDFTPGLSYFASNDRAYIRGIGRNTVNLATESGVATYYNGIYYGANASIAEQHSTLFVDQIEVDRGPQNTLHGSNADGGTINYISAKPTHSYYAEGRVGGQNDGEYYGEAVVSGPITDWLRFRVGGNYSKQSGGFFDNLIGSREGGVLAQGNNGNQEYFEAQLDANIGPHLDGWAMASAGDYHTSFHTASAVGNINDYEFPNGSLFPSGFYGLCGLAGHGMDAGCNLPGQQPIIPGSVTTTPINASSFPGNNPSNVNIRNFIQQYHDSNVQDHDLALATRWTYHFDGADLQYLGGFQQFYYNLGVSGNGYDAGVNSYQVATATGPLTIFPGGEHTSFIENEGYFSNELSLASTTPGPIQWIGGLYWYHEKYDQPVDLGCQPFQPQMRTPISLISPGFAAPNPHMCGINLDTHLTYDSYAGYGQVTWQITPEWKIEGAARYTDDRKDGIEDFRAVTFDQTVPGLAADVTPFAVSPFNPVTGKPYPGTGVGFYDAATGFEVRTLGASWNAVTGEVTLTWQPDSSTLSYLKYSRGYKTGGFNGGQVAAFPETAPEYVDSIEGGFKKTIGSVFQVNAAAFFYNYQNDQQPLTIQNSTGALFSDVFNIPSVHTYGVELEANWHPFQPVVFTAEYTYLQAKIASMNNTCVEDTVDPLAILAGSKTAGCPVAAPGSPQLVNLVGSSLPESPANKISLNALYTLNFDPGNVILSVSYVWKDKTYGSVFNIPQALAPSYSTVNLRAEWDDAKNRYNASVFVNNLFNTTGYDIVVPGQLAPAGTPYDLISGRSLTFPLTVGGEFQVRFR